MLKYLPLLLLLGLLMPLPAYQQQPFVNCYGLGCNLGHLLDVPVRIYNFLLGIAALVLLLVIVWAGLRMILFHVSEMPEAEVTNAKLTLTRGIFGFLIIAMSYIIVGLLLHLIGLSSDSYVGKFLQDSSSELFW